MSVRASVLELISSGPAVAWPWALLLAPALAAIVIWNRFYREVRVSGVSAGWLARYRQESRKH